jgi:hypothetical protein
MSVAIAADRGPGLVSRCISRVLIQVWFSRAIPERGPAAEPVAEPSSRAARSSS